MNDGAAKKASTDFVAHVTTRYGFAFDRGSTEASQ